MRRPSGFTLIVAALLLLALVVRLGYIAATPDAAIIRDARDYDRHARSIATGQGFAKIGSGPTGETAFRPPGYPYLLAGVYKITGVAEGDVEDRRAVGRVTNALIGVVIVGLIGLLAAQLFDRRIALVAIGVAAVYLPLVLAGGALMSEPITAALILGSLSAAIRARRETPGAQRLRWAAFAGLLAGLMVLTRANAVILLVPLAFAVWPGTVRPWSGWSWRSLAAPALLCAVAVAAVAPWTIRNAVVLDAFVPVSTQLGSALAGTYNESAYYDEINPASWRSPRRLVEFNDDLGGPPFHRNAPEVQVDKRLRAAALRFAADHPFYVLRVAYWNTRRALDLAGLRWSRHTAETISVPNGWATAGVVWFWVVALLAVTGAFVRRYGRWPAYVVAVPVLLYLSVVFMVFETPRYRTGIDPFIVLLAALALVGGWDRVRRRASADRGERVRGVEHAGV